MNKMIETGKWWTDSLNATIGCSPASPACQNCYACGIHTVRHRAYLQGKKLPKQYAKPFNKIQLLPGRLDKPLHWREPRIIFVDSMSDLFHENVPFEFIDEVFDVVYDNPQHIYLILTKRPHQMRNYFEGGYRHTTKNLWLGVTPTRPEDISTLLQIPAAHRFVSLEPLLEKIELYDEWNAENLLFKYTGGQTMPNTVHGPAEYDKWPEDSIDWVVVGAETGPKARYCPLEWIESVARQCQAAGVPVWVKAVHIGTAKKFKQVRKYNELPESVRVRQFPFKLATDGHRQTC